MTAETPGVAADLSDDDLLKRDGVLRALWWSVCPFCIRLIHGDTRCGCSKEHPGVTHCSCGGQHVGDVVGLSTVDGRQVWVCRGCYLEREVPP